MGCFHKQAHYIEDLSTPLLSFLFHREFINEQTNFIA